MMHAVKVQMMEIRWLNMGNKTFLDLVEILNETSNKAIFHTAFVTGLLSGYWDRYFQLILKTQFYPFLAYLFCMISWYVYALQSEGREDTVTFTVMYYSLTGACLALLDHQFRLLALQYMTSGKKSIFEFLENLWNLNDAMQLFLNALVIACNFFGQTTSTRLMH